jgi:hypothetical protein
MELKEKLIRKGHIPLDKSWIIRMGVLDLIHGKKDCIKFLRNVPELNEDLKALYKASVDWSKKQEIDVGESGTLYRFLQFASWELGLNKRFILHGTLKERKICDNPDIVNWPIADLLMIDGKNPKKRGTSQWASAAVLMGSQERLEDIDDPPFKLKDSYDAKEHWNKMTVKGKHWEPRYDETILLQALAFLDILNHRKINYKPRQPEDYCFARAFGFISKFVGEAKWPSLHGHESDRIEEMEKVIKAVEAGKMIESKDHRPVQAGAELQKVKGMPIRVRYPESVNKSWPMFWKFLEGSLHL